MKTPIKYPVITKIIKHANEIPLLNTSNEVYNVIYRLKEKENSQKLIAAFENALNRRPFIAYTFKDATICRYYKDCFLVIGFNIVQIPFEEIGNPFIHTED